MTEFKMTTKEDKSPKKLSPLQFLFSGQSMNQTDRFQPYSPLKIITIGFLIIAWFTGTENLLNILIKTFDPQYHTLLYFLLTISALAFLAYFNKLSILA